MAGSVNKVTLLGNLGRDPEVHQTTDGKSIVNMSIATSERWKDKETGEPRERTEWHRVVIFNEHIAEVAKKYLKKGNPVYVEGQLQTRKWTDDKGVEKYTTEVVLQRYRGELTLLGGNGNGNSGLNDPDSMASHQDGQPRTTAGNTDAPASPPADPTAVDDDIPY